ncbi:MAG: hypothetical protein KIT56_07940 [Gammaproteobacteria bacterium]|nr:hypothetical protein [Gammaproteobacteria bacterium]MCW5583791.1 hypothetical protein [Gammaproteobacteria bacterium]
MFMKIFVSLIVLIAVGVGLGTQLPRELLIKVIIFRDFFDAALPILAFGALIKYLCTCCVKCGSCHQTQCEDKKST